MKVENNSADPERAISPKYVIVLGICLLAMAGYVASSFLGRPDGPGAMASRALSARDAKDRRQAMDELALVVDRVAALPHLRRVAKESKDPEVQTIALSRLLSLRDRDSLPLCFDGLSHSSKEVREKVCYALRAYYGGSLPEELEYSADAPADGLAQVVAKLNEIHTRPRGARVLSPGGAAPGATTVAAAKKEPAGSSEPPGKELPALEPSSKDPPSSSAAPAPTSVHPPPQPFTPTEYPAISLLVWMCQELAILVLIVEVAGALSLIVGERHTAQQTPSFAKKAPANVEPPVEKSPPANSVVLWTKIALLVAGAVCILALLIAAEMVRLAVRVDQNVEFMRAR